MQQSTLLPSGRPIYPFDASSAAESHATSPATPLQIINPDPRVVKLVERVGQGVTLDKEQQWTLPPSILVLNKIDEIPREQKPLMLELCEQLCALHAFEDIFYISALRNRGVMELKQFLTGRAR